MVKRAGGSKACLTCLKRRKGCDLQRPACGQCRRLNLLCKGYSRPLVFKNMVSQGPPGKRKQNPYNTVKHEDTVTLHESLSHSAFYHQITGLYWKTYLPNGQRLPPGVSVVKGWIESIQSLEQQVEVIHKALLALSLATVGRFEAQDWMTKEGQRLYGHALSDTFTLIDGRRDNRISGKRSLELITTVRLLSFFEAVQLKADSNGEDRVTQANNWMIHNIGEASLVFSNPPSFYISGPAHRLFVDGRRNLACAGMRARKPSFLSENAWKTIPWTLNEKSPRDLLVDIAFDVPSLYERVDQLPLLEGSLLHARKQEAIITCLDLHRQLIEWKAANYTAYEKVLHRELTSNPSTQSMNAKTIMAAHESSFYWSLSLKVYSTLHDLSPTDDWLPSRSLSAMCCRNILCIIPVLLKPAMGMFRAHMATFPLGAAVTHVAAMRSEELQDVRGSLADYLARPECASIRQLIRSLQPENADYVLSYEVEKTAAGCELTGGSTSGGVLMSMTELPSRLHKFRDGRDA